MKEKLTMTTRELYLEGMDWKELATSDIIDKIIVKVASVMGPQLYKDCLMADYRPQEAFAEEYLSEYMHKTGVKDPELVDEQDQQEFHIQMGTNPEGEFALNAKEIPEKLVLKYCISKKGEKYLDYRTYSMEKFRAKDKYDVLEEEFSRTEILTILRLNQIFRALGPEQQEKWLKLQRQQHEKLTGEKLE